MTHCVRAAPTVHRDDELAELNREFEQLPASKIIQWAVDSFAPHLASARR